MSEVLYNHALALYDKLRETAQDEVWEGSMVTVFRSLGISQTYYSRLWGFLKETGSIEVLHTGRGGGNPSKVKLHLRPNRADFEGVYQPPLTNTKAHGKLVTRVEHLEGRLPNIDLNGFLLATDERLRLLEDRVTELERREVESFGKTQESNSSE